MPGLTATLGKHANGSIKLKNFEKALPKNLEKGFGKSGALLKSQIQRHLTGPSSSVDPSRRFPGVVTGRLRGSVTFRVLKRLRQIGLRVGPNVVYAAIQEFGGSITQVVTQKQRMFLGLSKGIWVTAGSTLHIRIPKRPYVWPAWEKKKKSVVKIMQDAIMRPIRT